jgi:acyl-CoA synthetase (NDP forming)
MTSSFDPLFNPKSIAVAGASNTPGKLGYDFIRRLSACFHGTLAAINPRESEVAGVPAVARLADVQGHIDLAIALLPGERLLEVIEACPAGKVRFLAAVPSGFAEVSQMGNEHQKRLAQLAQARGMRILGPNIVGIFNGVSGLNASLMPALAPGGHGLSCLTQSGGFGMALSMYALDRNIRVAKFCDLGNMADVEVHEILDYFAEDAETRVIGLFLESVRTLDPAIAALKRAAERKPVILTPVGVQAAGRRASLSHLGLTESAARLVAAAPRSVIRAATAQDLLNAANACLRQPRAAGRRVAIVTGTGGIGAELADLCTEYGLDVVAFSEKLRSALGELLPAYAGLGNPVDLTPIWWDYPKIYPRVLDAISASGEADIVIVCITDVPTQYPDLAEALALWGPRATSSQSYIVFWGSRDQDLAGMTKLESAGFPCFRSTREAAVAATALAP